MKTRIGFIVLVLLSISCSVEVSTQSDTELLNRTIDDFNSAFEKVDMATLDKLTAEQYTHVNGHHPTINKKDWMTYLKKRKDQLDGGQLKITKYAFNKRKLTLYDHSAFVTGVVEVDGILENTEFSHKIRVSHFWVKENAQWKRAGFHDVRIE